MNMRAIDLKRSGPAAILAILLLTALTMFRPYVAPAQDGNPQVRLTTGKGVIVLELDPAKAPATVANFLKYVKAGYYDGLVFHRVIDGFMIQGGGLDKNLREKPGAFPAIANEADNGLKNKAYTVAMARTSDPNSATSQFFINVADNAALDHVSKTSSGWGYAVFGKVVQGREVVDAIKGVPTASMGGMSDVPREPVEILKAEVVGK
jgi:peptidyl-prolyl cis-trans isomerase B (cyclophilin B)